MGEATPPLAKRAARIAQRFHKAKGGTIAIMSAAVMALVVGAAAIAIDLAALFTEKRQAQGAVDLAAMAAASDLARAHAAAVATLKANRITDYQHLAVETGTYTADATLAPAQRFMSGAVPANAARVTLTKPGQTYFAKVFSPESPTIQVRGTARNAALASLSVGSRLLSVHDGLINALLGKLFGSSVSLEVMDYKALVDADIKVLPLMKALASELNMTAATYNDVLATSAKAGNLLSAMASVADADGNSAAHAALKSLASQTEGSSVTVPLSEVIDLGPLGLVKVADGVPGFDASYKAMDLINAAAVAAGGDNQLTLNLGLNIPGVTALTLDIAIGEPPQGTSWSATGEPGIRVRTAQTRLRLLATVAGNGLLSGVGIRLPIYLQIAHAEARLDSVSCLLMGGVESVGVSAKPGVAEVWIGELSGSMSNFNFAPTVSQANIVDAGIARVRGSAHVLAGNTAWHPLTFSKGDIAGAVVKTVETNNLAESLVSSLVSNLDLDVEVLGLGFGLGPVISALVGQLLSEVAAPLDAVVFALLNSLGVHLGEADVRVHGALCNGARLAG